MKQKLLLTLLLSALAIVPQHVLGRSKTTIKVADSPATTIVRTPDQKTMTKTQSEMMKRFHLVDNRDSRKANSPLPELNKKINSDAQTVNIDLHAEWESGIIPQFIFAIYDDGFGIFYFDLDDQSFEADGTVEFPSGFKPTDFILFCYDDREDTESSYVIIVKELVDIYEGQRVEFKTTEATNKISYEIYMPDGEQVRYNRTDQNVVECIDVFEIVSPNGLFIPLTEIKFGIQPILVNDVSDRYTWPQVACVATFDDSALFINQVARGCQKETVANNPQDFVKVRPDFFCPTKAFEKYGEGLDIPPYYAASINCIKGTTGFGVGLSPLTEFYVCQPTDSDPMEDGMITYIQQFDLPTDDGLDHGVTTLPIFVNPSRFEFINHDHNQGGDASYCMTDKGIFEWFPGHERYSYTLDEIGDNKIGYSAPICVMMDQELPGWMVGYDCEGVRYILPTYLGRLGETRHIDGLDLDWTFAYNGENLLSSGEVPGWYDPNNYFLMTKLEYLMNAVMSWGIENPAPGEYDIIMTNNNVRIEGIVGYNKTHIYTDRRLEDFYAPTLQMLMFRDNEDKITDQFVNAADGVMEFSGADFDLSFSPSYTYIWYSPHPMTVKVEWSPNGLDEWSEFENIEELPEYFREINFGYFYRTSLEGVDRPSENKWYDLRFTLSDGSGNYQEQVVSPAFRVENPTPSSIDAVVAKNGQLRYMNGSILVADGMKAMLTVTDTSGRQLVRTVGSRVDVSTLPSGAYIARMVYGSNVETMKFFK